MHQSQRSKAGAFVLDDDAQRPQVKELAEIHVLVAHLVPDAVDVLWPARNLGRDPQLRKR